MYPCSTSSGQALACGLDNTSCDAVRIAICCRTTVFHVAPAVLLSGARDANGCTTISHTKFELSDAARLMLTCQTLVVALAILSDVFRSHLAERFANFRDDVVAALCAHLL